MKEPNVYTIYPQKESCILIVSCERILHFLAKKKNLIELKQKYLHDQSPKKKKKVLILEFLLKVNKNILSMRTVMHGYFST